MNRYDSDLTPAAPGCTLGRFFNSPDQAGPHCISMIGVNPARRS
jgi:hypothetical protein